MAVPKKWSDELVARGITLPNKLFCKIGWLTVDRQGELPEG